MLDELLADPGVEVVELLTSVGEETGRSSVHGVSRGCYERQAEAVGVPIRVVALPEGVSNDVYEERMGAATADYESRDVDAISFGDLFLEDVRAYRVERLADAAIEPAFPLWGRDPAAVAEAVLDRGFEATLVAVDGDRFDPAAGRPHDRAIIDSLPDGVDPAGENGAFHTFVHGGPVLDAPLPVEVGETVTRAVGDGEFHYADLTMADDG